MNDARRNFEMSQVAHKHIPGGAHTYSRGDDQFPSNAPAILERGKDAYVWDCEGNRFLDFGMGLRSVTLGYANERVQAAAIAEIQKGNNLTRASETEVLAAQEFCELIPWCEMVKFAKNGSTVVTAATKLARAYTGRKYIARCADHPFFSFDDWFIGSTVVNRGVPEPIANLTLSFEFNKLESFIALVERHGNDIACVVMEPSTSTEPLPGFLQQISRICQDNGIVFVLDEMITGFRWDLRGACAYYDIKPDLVTFGKGMANGFSVAALGGRRELMELGGLRHSKERVFLVSTTHGAEMCGLGAFRETLRIYQECNVTKHLWSIGQRLVNGLNAAAKEAGAEELFQAWGAACSPAYTVKDLDGNVSLPLRTVFLQEMINQGIIISYISLSLAHTEIEIDRTIRAAQIALSKVKEAADSGVEKYLLGAAVKPVFRKYN